MALGQVIGSAAFVREPIYRHRFEWQNPAVVPYNMADSANPKLPKENSLYDVRLLGYKTHTGSNATNLNTIRQNSIGWAFGIPQTIDPVNEKGVISDNRVEVYQWVSYIRAQTDSFAASRNPLIHYNAFDIVAARLHDINDNIVVQIVNEDTKNWTDYTPVENDIALFFKKENEGTNLVLQHASLCFNIHSAYNFLDKPALPKWSSKMGSGSLIEHHIGLLSDEHNTNQNYLVDMENGAEQITQGSLKFIIKNSGTGGYYGL